MTVSLHPRLRGGWGWGVGGLGGGGRVMPQQQSVASHIISHDDWNVVMKTIQWWPAH